MNRLLTKASHAQRRKNRVRSAVHGSTHRPRLAVRISSRHISVQIIDDDKQKTIAQATTVGLKESKQSLSQQATTIGAEIARRAKAKKVKKVALDRGQRLYHGRIKALAEAARKEGLEF